MNGKINTVASKVLIGVVAFSTIALISGCNRSENMRRSESAGAPGTGPSTAMPAPEADGSGSMKSRKPSQQDSSSASSSMDRSVGNMSGGTASGNSISSADREFMMNAAVGNLFEVKVGEVAASRATSPEVKAFAKMLVRHHSAANDELSELAKSKNITLPSALPAAKKSLIDSLGKLSGAQFDREFIHTVGLTDHQEDIKNFGSSSI